MQVFECRNNAATIFAIVNAKQEYPLPSVKQDFNDSKGAFCAHSELKSVLGLLYSQASVLPGSL